MYRLSILTFLLTSVPLNLFAENIEIDTFTPVETSANSTGNHSAIENYLSPSTNVKKNEPRAQSQAYIEQPLYPVYPAYNSGGYFYPGVSSNAISPVQSQVQSWSYFSSVLPMAQAALEAGLKIFTKLGLFVVGGAGLLVIGGIFTTLICYLTPICTISFNGWDFQKTLTKDTMRSLMTPEKIASAAALVQDAIGKYQRLQRAVNQ
ncbi:hypothetical protein ABEB36_005721 [Hypothenemus hampei]|uniref:Uncharacterized protein n=1 Tax=Hypothenemus hampei TaxID=57062 RepID=A0ABD1EZ71_HYPHA